MWSTALLAQNRITASGTVRDSSGAALPSVSFTVKGTKTSGATDAQGNFRISVPVGSTLVFSAVGYTTHELRVTGDGFVTVTMESNSKNLSEVVVTGFGQRKEARKVTYAVTEVKGSELVRANNANIVDALQGKVAGVFVSQGTGGPSSSARIRIRGNATLDNNAQPLVVIDGILIDQGTTGSDSWGDGQDFGNIMKNLNPDDYESVTVLKGSAASALYGSRALNGVLLITTKKGRVRKGIGASVAHTESFEHAYKTLDFQNEFGGGLKPTFDKVNGVDVVDNSAGPWNTPDGGYSYGPKFDGHMVQDLDGRMVPWVPNKPLDFFQTGKYINTNVAMEGGSDRGTFRFSYSNLYNNSIMPTDNSLTRNVFSLHATQKLSSFLTMDASVSYSTNKIKDPIIQGGNDNPLFFLSYYMARNAPFKYWENHYIDSVHGGRKSTPTADPYYLAHVMWTTFQNHKTQKEDNLLANLDLNIDLGRGLSALVRTNVNQFNSFYEEKDNGPNPGFAGQYYKIQQGSYKNVRIQGLLSYTRKFGDNFDLNASAGGETYRQLGGLLTSQNTNGGFTYLNIYTIGNSAQAPSQSVDYTTYPAKRIDAVYALGDLTWKDMLTFNFSVRNDWSSTLTYRDGHGDYGYLYPSFGLAWVFTELDRFKHGNSVLSFGKLRASIGWTGSDATPYITNNQGWYGNNGTFNSPTGNQNLYGFTSNTLGNLHLKNELAREMEFGADLRFLDNRLGVDVAYYKKNSFNQILSLDADQASGVTSTTVNAGNIQNQGVEILLTATPVRTRDFTWNATVNFTRNRNKIIALVPGTNSKSLELAFGADVQAYAVVGKDYGTVMTGYGFATYHSKTDANSPSNGKRVIGNVSGPAEGNYSFMRSQDYDGSQKTLGNIMEKWMGGTTQTLMYKNFVMNIQVDAKIGGLMASATHQYGSQTGAFTNSLFGRDKAHGGVEWTDASNNHRDDGIIPDGVLNDGIMSGSVDLGGMTYADAVKNGYLKPIPAEDYYQNLSQWSSGIREYSVFDNSWVSLREVSIGYNLPAKFYQKIKFNALRVSLIGRNLGYLYKTAPIGINPEGFYTNRAAGFAEYGGLPFTRNLGFTVNASF